VSQTTVTFYLPKLADVSDFDAVDPDTEWTRFLSARAQAIPHTYVRLRHAGHPVRMANRPPSAGIAVVFAGDMHRFVSHCESRDDVVVVCVQADRRVPEVSLADVVVQHNGLQADDERRFFIPNWPQSGLVPRDTSRGPSVRTVSYKGDLSNLRSDFLAAEWDRFLADHGLVFVVDADLSPDDPRRPRSSDRIRVGSRADWNNYRESDVVLAVRPGSGRRYRHKPAVKLVNAWRAHVPAMLGPEPAYQELRRSELDYLEVDSVQDAKRALTRLLEEPGRYQAMVANSRDRGSEFTVEAITARWEELLFATLRNWTPSRVTRAVHRATVPLRRVVRGVRRRIALPVR
jgi:hypothetical protein